MKVLIAMILIAGAALAQETRLFVGPIQMAGTTTNLTIVATVDRGCDTATHAVLVSSTGEVRDECDSKVIAKIETDGSVTGDAAKALALIVRALSKAYQLPAK